MRSRKPIAALFFFMGAFVYCSISRADAAVTVVDLQHLTLQQRLALPSTAIVRTSQGKLVTMKALQGQHIARLTQLSAASARGATIGAQLALRERTLLGGNGRPLPPVVLIPAGQRGIVPADFKGFCTAARDLYTNEASQRET